MSSTLQPADSLCPHFREIDEELLEQLSSEVAKVRSQKKGLFEFTHRQIEVFDALDDGEETITEDEIYETLTSHHEGNFAVVIEGNVGTGKSELCAYLSHQLQSDDRPVLHIGKNADLLSIMAEEIPNFYRDHFEGELPGAGNAKRLQRHVSENRREVARLVVSKAALAISDLDDTTVNLAGEPREKLEDFVEQKLTAISQRGELAEKVRFVEPKEVEEFSYLNVFDTKSTVDAAEAWNEAIWDAVRDEYDSPSMDQLLKRVGQKFGDNRPVLVFEDFSISALDAEKLRNYMEDDSPENNWDFIIAGTQDATEVLHTQTGLERHEFYRTNRPDSSSVLFLDRDTCVDFIRPFLGYVKHLDGSVRYERSPSNTIVEIDEPDPDSLCAECGFCDQAFRDLFPFNEIFLRRIYEGLQPEDQRPRKYVEKVFNVLEDYYTEIVDSPASSDELDELSNPLTVHDDIYVNEPLRRLTTWYGTPASGGDRLLVDPRFATAFGIDESVLDELPIELEEGSAKTDGAGRLWSVPVGGADTGMSSGGTSGGSGGSTGKTETKSPEEQKIIEMKGYLDAWRNDPSSSAAEDLDVYMRRGLKDALDTLTEGFSLHNNGDLEYFVGGNEEPFVLDGHGIADRDQVQIDPTDFPPSELLALLEYGVYREMNANDADEVAFFEVAGTHMTGYARKWRENVRTTHIGSSTNFFTRGSSQYSFEDLVVAMYGMAAVLDDPWQPLTAERIEDAYLGSELTVDEDLRDGLSNRMMQEQLDEIEEFMDQSAHAESLLDEYFAASDSVLDRREIRAHLESSPPLDVLDGLKKTGLEDLPANLRLGSGAQLRDIFLTGWKLPGIFDGLAGDEEATAVVELVDGRLRGADFDATREYIERIRTYDDLEPETMENLGRLTAYREADFEELLSACELHEDLSTADTTQRRLHGTLAGLKIQQHDLASLIDDLELSAGGTHAEFEEFQELSDRFTDLN